ncbi:pentatricopeptide repeat-containing protein At2g40720-like [Selaginella moellendorffii]|uniref:pentatricopeptide repeat-containing protein At2g40720-like n=1 Tax=Selaginella moellendorffii TaxID=88036 RepID=UPI000D1C63F7|nr:pentatricopeptide repeat-containing protein At2g40720-like [Selaginella moellendorffii]|eukprot:XP_024540112.1 pentatricopeptide repeat-containing protein At2g40720-like [Selaginella moellendorffii]
MRRLARGLATDCASNQLNLREYLDSKLCSSDVFTLARLIRECGSLGNLLDAQKIHSHVVESGFQENFYLRERLVHMYLKCGSVENAEDVFLDRNRMAHFRDVTTWTAMLSAYSRQSSSSTKVLEFYCQMLQHGVKPDSFTFTAVLKACVSVKRALSGGKAIHFQILESGLEDDEIIGTSVVSMYGKCSSLADARAWFDGVCVRRPHGVVLWNAMISAYVQNGCCGQSLELFTLMLLEGVAPNSVTYVTVLNACSSTLTLGIGKAVHICVCDLGLESDVILGTALLNMYGKSGKLDEARKIFERIEAPDLVSWNSMISALVRDSQGDGARTLFKQLLLEGLSPNEITLISTINACACPEDLTEGKLIHACSCESGRASVLFVRNALVDMYGKCGCLEKARELFESETVERNLVSWSVMVAAYAENGHGHEALQLFRMMILEGESLDSVVFVNVLNACSSAGNAAAGEALHGNLVEAGFESDVVAATALANMYIKCGRLEDGRRVFDRMEARNVVSWNTMISGYAQNGRPKEALELFHQMDPGVADKRTYVAALDACACSVAATEGKLIHQQILQQKMSVDVILGTAIVNMYGKCGCLSEAREFFDSIPLPDVVTCNAMIAGYAQHGHLRKALGLFAKMKQEGVRPDGATFVSVLCACSHAGNLKKGSEFFISMLVDYEFKISAEHCGCMLDLLSRSGMLREAEELLKKYPTSARDTEWITLLAASKTQSDATVAQNAAEGLMNCRPESSFPYVVLSTALSTDEEAA